MSRIRATSSTAVRGLSTSSASKSAAEDKYKLIQTKTDRLDLLKLSNPLGSSQRLKRRLPRARPKTKNELIHSMAWCVHA